MGPILLVSLVTSYHPFLQGISNLLYFLGVAAYWDSVVLITGYSMSPGVVLEFVVPIITVSRRFLVFIWAFIICRFLESVIIASCDWVSIWESVKLMIVWFLISSLYSTA